MVFVARFTENGLFNIIVIQPFMDYNYFSNKISKDKNFAIRLLIFETGLIKLKFFMKI